VAALQAEAPVPSQCPLDATIFALQAADVLADALLEEGLPGKRTRCGPRTTGTLPATLMCPTERRPNLYLCRRRQGLFLPVIPKT
jgi:hypothetical protein